MKKERSQQLAIPNNNKRMKAKTQHIIFDKYFILNEKDEELFITK